MRMDINRKVILRLSGKNWQIRRYLASLAKYKGNLTLGEIAERRGKE